jgi:hypothetical protein
VTGRAAELAAAGPTGPLVSDPSHNFSPPIAFLFSSTRLRFHLYSYFLMVPTPLLILSPNDDLTSSSACLLSFCVHASPREKLYTRWGWVAPCPSRPQIGQ